MMKALLALFALASTFALGSPAHARAPSLECERGETYRQMRVLVSGNRELRLISMGRAYPARQASGVGIRSSGLYEICISNDKSGNYITAAKRVR